MAKDPEATKTEIGFVRCQTLILLICFFNSDIVSIISSNHLSRHGYTFSILLEVIVGLELIPALV